MSLRLSGATEARAGVRNCRRCQPGRELYGAEQEPKLSYAPLSSGLDIVRKVLGQHEIATTQTTSIDQDAGLISLNDSPGACVRQMDRLGLAGLRCQRCPALCPVHTGVGMAGEGVGRSHGWADIPAKLGSFRQIVSRNDGS